MKLYAWLSEVLTSPDVPDSTKVLAAQIYPAMLDHRPPPEMLVADREAVHTLADFVIAPDQYRRAAA